ncbi:SDR family NAD(P)-dependent oxidoreductase [Catenulispora pinisilvae]|uniref:SDR family NAD(P)-dependent oxidoreductase n=1 Tax=Catenulispora pinisilvae TaxID=2705253 RepID=UPI001E3C18C6|nr:SDR family oxidoreductase [Catenulispora pinisilvae]
MRSEHGAEHRNRSTCLVIGAGSGIGTAILRRAEADGFLCHATARGPRPVQPVQPVQSDQPIQSIQSIQSDQSVQRDQPDSPDQRDQPPSAAGWSSGDVSRPEDIVRMVAEATTALGRVDSLVYCPAVAEVGPIESLTPQAWTTVLEVNIRGFGLAVSALLPQWRAAGIGRAVVLSSQAARRGQALISAYTASKAGLEGLVRALAVELAPVVRVNAVAPGIVLTPMIEEDFRRQAAAADVDPEEIARRTAQRIPLGSFQRPESVAAMVVFLLGRGAADITGQCIAVDGGMTA